MNNLTEQEKKFADTFVYLFFHLHAIYAGMGAEAARVAGYDVPDDMNKADNLEKSLLGKEKIKQYIDSEIERFREILSDDQSMNLWKHISEFKPGEAANDLLDGGCIIRH